MTHKAHITCVSLAPKNAGEPDHRFTLFLLSVIFVALVESYLGRSFWGPNGESCIATVEHFSSPSSQCFADTWSLGHAEHGIVVFLVFELLRRRGWLYVCPDAQLLWAITAEAAWEIYENSNYAIGLSRDESYIGDSMLNSIGDQLFCILGFLLARRVGAKRAFCLIVLWEVTGMLLVGDCGVRTVARAHFPNVEWLQPRQSY